MLLFEKTRTQLVSDSKRAKKEKDGKTRFQKRVNSRIGSSVNQYNQTDMNKFFKKNILDVNIQVYGETDNYIVTLSFGGVLDNLKRLLKEDKELELKDIVQAIIISFNRDDVYIHCSCPDWQYRMAYFASKKDINAGQPELRPSVITNPDDDLGDGCKHSLLVLSNMGWVIKISRVIFNYINYMKEHQKRLYADIIYPAIYGKKYKEPVQLDVFDDDTLSDDEETIDTANKQARAKGQFAKGNQQGVRFAPKNNQQQSIDDLEGEDNA